MENLAWLDALSSRIDKEEMLNLASRLMEKNTVNPPGNEFLVKDILIEYLKKIGARIKVYEPAPGRLSILGCIGEDSPVVAIISHMDVVPPGEGWDFDPFSPRIKDGKIYGRGAVDNKGPFAASWAGVKALLDAKIPLRGTIVLGAVADEEKGSRYGMQYLLEKDFHPDFCIIPDGGKLDEIVIGEKGRMEVYLRTQGKSAHASEPQKGENAIYKMVSYLESLKNFSFKNEHHPLFEPATLNLGQIKGGQAPNIVPDSCEATFDIRYPLGMEEDEMLCELKALASKYNLKVEIAKRNFSAKPHLLDIEHPLTEIFKDTAEKIGISLKVGTMGGITLAKNLYFRNIPAVVHSPATESVAHQANEYVKIENLVTCAKIWAGVVGGLLKAD
ncbi:M20 family metallopeptidase [Candidatus Aerophobetes bacterium]|nr:M20 family metallopeptidase [Candidatus Aerophobetes bacterium]